MLSLISGAMALKSFLRKLHALGVREPEGRPQGISREALESIQKGTLGFSYRGFGCWKSPFDLALYTLLLQNLRPRTIVELGSGEGGSALWFADLVTSLKLGAHVYSFDLQPVSWIVDSRISFESADIYQLGGSRLSEVLRSAERPVLVIEDGPHSYAACLEALEFCDSFLHPGDYIVIEDGIVHSLGLEGYDDGPTRAIASFLRNHKHRYETDRTYCDYYGPNFTWNPNGYLKRI